MRNHTTMLLRFAVLAWGVYGAGCATVPAWEKGRLARPDMVQGEHARLTAGEEHATAYREGATGATGAAAGGCGCN